MSTVEIVVKDETELVSRGDTLTAEVEALVVCDDASYRRGAQISKDLASWLKAGTAFFKSMKDPAHKAWRAICDRETEVLGPRETLKLTLSRKMTAYEQEMARQAEIAAAAARADQERLEREALALAEAETKRLRDAEEARRIEEAVAAAERGDHETADRLISAPVVTPTVVPAVVFQPPVMVPTAPKVEGISYRTDYSALVRDVGAVVKAAASGNSTALGLLEVSQVKANALARALKDGFSVPGVELVRRRIQITKT